MVSVSTILYIKHETIFSISANVYEQQTLMGAYIECSKIVSRKRDPEFGTQFITAKATKPNISCGARVSMRSRVLKMWENLGPLRALLFVKYTFSKSIWDSHLFSRVRHTRAIFMQMLSEWNIHYTQTEVEWSTIWDLQENTNV